MSAPHQMLRDVLAERHLSQAQLAEMTGRDRPWVSRVLSGKYPLGPSFALDLEAALGIRAEYWCRLQADWSVQQERDRRAR